jgi:hypothetical protein
VPVIVAIFVQLPLLARARARTHTHQEHGQKPHLGEELTQNIDSATAFLVGGPRETFSEDFFSKQEDCGIFFFQDCGIFWGEERDQFCGFWKEFAPVDAARCGEERAV